MEKFRKNYSTIIMVAAIVAASLIMPIVSVAIQGMLNYTTDFSYMYLIQYILMFIANLMLAYCAWKKNTNILFPIIVFFLGNIIENVYMIIEYNSAGSYINLVIYSIDIILLLIFFYAKNQSIKSKFLMFLYVIMLVNLAHFATYMFSGSELGLSQVLTILGFIGMLYMDDLNSKNLDHYDVQ